MTVIRKPHLNEMAHRGTTPCLLLAVVILSSLTQHQYQVFFASACLFFSITDLISSRICVLDNKILQLRGLLLVSDYTPG